MGRARAWLRLALMQKKLADYLKVLIDHKDEALVEYFEPDALMLSDEAIIIIGLLVGLNVIDCNLCVKVVIENLNRRRWHLSIFFIKGRRFGLPTRSDRLLFIPKIFKSNYRDYY